MQDNWPPTPFTNKLSGTTNAIAYTGTNDTGQGTLDIVQTLSGSPAAKVGANTFSIPTDNAVVPSGVPLAGLYTFMNLGGPLFTGNRVAIQGWCQHTRASAALAASLAAGGTDYNCVGVQGYATCNQNLGGVGGSTTPGNNLWCGNFTAGNSNVFMGNGATYMKMVCAHEFDIQIPAGSSSRQKFAILIAKTQGDANQGAADDAAIAMGDQTGVTVPWKYGISFSTSYAPWSFDNTSTLIGAQASGIGVTFTANIGVDLSGITFNTAPIKLPGGLLVLTGSGAPGVAAPVGSMYFRTDGSSGSTLYIKESGTGTSGWTAK